MKNLIILITLFSFTFLSCENSSTKAKKETTTVSNTKEGLASQKESIQNLFSSEESERKQAARDLVFEYGKTEGMVNALVSYALNDENFVEDKQPSLWQTTYILTQLSSEMLSTHKTLIEQFMTKMKDNQWAGERTLSDFDTILEKMK